jgi:N-acetylmuramoyl-L-alanine amidase
MNRRMRQTLLIASGALILTGCAARKPGFEGLYAGLKEKPHTMDSRVLSGKVIVIDPGHGGLLHGSIGADSLREADVNLGTALYLWGLCKDAGADVHLTRTTDRDFLPPESTEPGDDLRVRVAMANGLNPDVFISIHHNANIPVRRDINKTEVYYRASDPGPSLELAQDIQLHLARNLGIETSEIRPGNYFVLRYSTAHAAVLGEASYLSSPVVEQRLKLSLKQKLEAEAYFLGLIDYFSRGVPRLTRIAPARDTLASPPEISFSVTRSENIPIDPASARITVGSRALAVLFDPVTSTMRLPPDPGLPNGTYTVEASVRSTRGATARSSPCAILIARPARFILPLAPREKPESVVALSVTVLDALGMHVADGTPVTARSLEDGTSLSGSCADGVFTVEVPRELAGGAFEFTVSNVTDTVRFAAIGDNPRFAVIACDARTGEGVAGASVLRGARESFTADERGRLLVPASGAPETLVVFAAGYRPLLIDTSFAGGGSPILRALLEPLFGGALDGRRIALDPEGGGTDAGGSGTGGLRGASVNLAIARELRDFLERAGAEVILTREGDEPISPQERVYVVNRAGAELAIGIGHSSPPKSIDARRIVLHYAGSEGGRAIAEKLAVALAPLPPGGAFATGEWVDAFLQQTACTACEIYCGPVEDAAYESLMMNAQWLRLEAEMILGAVAEYFGYDAAAPGSLVVKVVSRGTPMANAAVDIDRLFTRTTDGAGSASFGLIDPGLHLVTVRTSDGRAATLMRMTDPNERELTVELP